MKKLKQIFIYTLAALILFSSLGISFYLHHCGCQHTILVSVSVGFNEPEPETCCSSCNPKPSTYEDGLSFSRKGCCQDFAYFYLLPVTKDNVFQQLTHVLVTQIIKAIISTPEISDFSFAGEIFHFLHSPPLLFSGRKIIYLLHQIKIPSPAC